MSVHRFHIRLPAGASVPISGEVTVGRGPHNGVVVNDEMVSRTHCVLIADARRLIVSDVSSNGTFVGGVRIGAPTEVRHGDLIRLGESTLVVHDAAEATLPVQAIRAGAFAPAVQNVVSLEPGPAARLTDTAPRDAMRGALHTIAPAESSVDVEVVEDVGIQRYRDALQSGDSLAVLVLTDVVVGPKPSRAQIDSWRRALRQSGAVKGSPPQVLELLNAEFANAGLIATATVVRLDAKERIASVACAGAPAPWVIRAGGSLIRVDVPPSVELGRVETARFVMRDVHFERADTLIVASEDWHQVLPAILAEAANARGRVAPWLRNHPGRPPAGSLLALSVT